MKTSTVLEKAKAVLVEKGWTQQAFARDERNRHSPIHSPEATCFCTLGALELVTGHMARSTEHAVRAQTALERTLLKRVFGDDSPIQTFNDDENTTKEDVLAWFDRAIELAKERET